MESLLLTFLVVIIGSLCARMTHSETCYALNERCRSSVPRVEKGSFPMSEADILATQQKAQDFCRATNTTALCMQEFEERCASDPMLTIYRGAGDFYERHVFMAEAKMCQLSINPIRYDRARTHCYRQRPNFEKDLLAHRSTYLRISPDTAVGKRNFCETLQVTAERLDGTAKAELTAKCGAEAVTVMKEVADKLHAAQCAS
ncbi:uncharacterized protein LOC129588849 [Paramacrobiotus metropolitanus]|uniref:uncharacterized protein LOC129588849 n=1 Tax=Paramacrobiotus metropolitanus TaxID=2943436 RepID=UPI0024464802|nr:uncharacterized protein LOC129588849 [Paramacrobiotus metropolitanus]